MTEEDPFKKVKAEENTGLPKELLVGDRPFGITIERIKLDVARWQDNLKKANDKLAETNLRPELRETLLSMKSGFESALKFTVEEIFKKLKNAYSFIRHHEQQGLSRDDIVKAMKRDEPELVASLIVFGDSVGGQAWVYLVVQSLLSPFK